MNFTFTWVMDKLGYIPKIDMEIGKVHFFLDESKKKTIKVPKATTRKVAVKKPVARKKKTV